jgi:hypothetical protein
VAWTIINHPAIDEWLADLDNDSLQQVVAAVDPARRAVLLVAGDKAGQWQEWYKRAIPLADDRFDEHLARMPSELQGKTSGIGKRRNG